MAIEAAKAEPGLDSEVAPQMERQVGVGVTWKLVGQVGVQSIRLITVAVLARLLTPEDYGAAAVDGDSVWIASEYIAHTCDYTDWGGPFFAGGTGDNLLGTCGGASHGPGPRTALGNWSTRISKLTP